MVKLRLCPKHALQLNHKQNEQLLKKRKRDSDTATDAAQDSSHKDKPQRAETQAGAKSAAKDVKAVSRSSREAADELMNSLFM